MNDCIVAHTVMLVKNSLVGHPVIVTLWFRDVHVWVKYVAFVKKQLNMA